MRAFGYFSHEGKVTAGVGARTPHGLELDL